MLEVLRPMFRQVWSLWSCEELRIFELGGAVTSVVMDHSELTLYAGDSSGNVFSIDLHYKVSQIFTNK